MEDIRLGLMHNLICAKIPCGKGQLKCSRCSKLKKLMTPEEAIIHEKDKDLL